ncbi:MAG: MAPEG family protein [Hyphomonadaceae bacterium]|nr:MAPEG family protein [Hyphomonadaceae bacterium]
MHTILAPVMALVAWSLIMLAWLALTRLPAMAKSDIPLAKVPPGGRGQNLEGVLPDRVNWPSHNYAHLMEQPVLFYATALVLHAIGPSALALQLAWTYVGLRVAHSLWQALVNTVPIRFMIFSLASACLLGMAYEAIRGVLAM